MFKRPYSLLVRRMRCRSFEKSRPLLDINTIEGGFSKALCACNPFSNKARVFSPQRQQSGRREKGLELHRFGKAHYTLETLFDQGFRCPVGARLKAPHGGDAVQNVHEPTVSDADGREHPNSRNRSSKERRKILFDEVYRPGENDYPGGEDPGPKTNVPPPQSPADHVQA